MKSRTYIDVHILQSVPPSCINRDDTGSPKTATYGGVRRARVSSQAWKRATRKAFEDLLGEQDLGIRTKRVVEMVAHRLTSMDVAPVDAPVLAEAVVKAAGLKLKKAKNSDRKDSKYLVLVSWQQAGALAELANNVLESAGGDVNAAAKELGVGTDKKAAKRVLAQKNSVDLALFGRMVADDTDLNVDASCQVAHALSVHAADTEFDYFTAVDDLKEREDDFDEVADAGAGMIGTVEFTSATLYRYASINVEALAANLGDVAMTERGIAAFIRGFALSMPTGKINTFANNTVPDGVLIRIRDDQPISLVGAFERPVTSDGGYALPAAEALRDWADSTAEAFGAPALAGWVVGVGEVGEALGSVGERSTFASLPEAVASAAVARLADPA